MIRLRSVLVPALLCGVAFGTAGQAEAGKRRGKKKPAAAAQSANVNVRAIGELMGQFKFGMTSKDVLKVLAQQIDERYQDKIKATEDVYAQDQLRRDKAKEVGRIKNSFVEFKGEKTGWDVSIIDDQFAQGSDESMMVYWENAPDTGKDQRRFFFFHDGSLYKMFIALNSGMLKDEQRSFGYFQGIMEKRYGSGKLVTTTDRQGVERPALIEWRTKDYHLEAVDKLDFYGSFCLLIADPSVEKTVASIREANKKAPEQHQVVDAVLGKGADGKDPENPSLDENKGTVDAVLKGN